MSHFISELTLSALDCAWLQVKDFYGYHRVVYGLFGHNDTDKTEGRSNEILWRLVSESSQGVRILVLSDCEPGKQDFGNLSIKEVPEKLLQADFYRYSICVNPTRCVQTKRIPIVDTEEICSWFKRKAEKSGFEVDENCIALNSRRVVRFKKNTGLVTLFQVDLSGTLRVTSRADFVKAFYHGIGRGKAFGCGLLQIIPIH